MAVVRLKGLGEYDEIPKEAVLASKYLARLWSTLGRPETPFTESGKKLMDKIIFVWKECYPIDYDTFMAQKRDHMTAEMTISEQVRKHTGRSLASYPYPIYKMMKTLFIGFDPGEKKNCIKMIQNWPIFRMVNKI